jgi:hypothetical protein
MPRAAEPRERTIVRDIRLALGKRDDVVLWRNAINVSSHDGRFTRGGLGTGSADLVGVLRLPSGVGAFIAIEVKRSTKAPISDAQIMFLNLVRKMGGLAIVATNTEDCERGIRQFLAER